MSTSFETNPPQTVDEAKEYLRKVSSVDVEDPELAAENFALAIYPLCCVVDAAWSGAESPSEDQWRDVCDRFETYSNKLLTAISTWIEYKEARRLVDGDAETTMQSKRQEGIPPSSNDVPTPTLGGD